MDSKINKSVGRIKETNMKNKKSLASFSAEELQAELERRKRPAITLSLEAAIYIIECMLHDYESSPPYEVCISSETLADAQKFVDLSRNNTPKVLLNG